MAGKSSAIREFQNRISEIVMAHRSVGHPVGLTMILKGMHRRHLPLAQASGVRGSNRSTGPICPAAPVAAQGCPHSLAMTRRNWNLGRLGRRSRRRS